MISDLSIGYLCPPQDFQLRERFRIDYWELRYQECLVLKAPHQVLDSIKKVLDRLRGTA